MIARLFKRRQHNMKRYKTVFNIALLALVAYGLFRFYMPKPDFEVLEGKEYQMPYSIGLYFHTGFGVKKYASETYFIENASMKKADGPYDFDVFGMVPLDRMKELPESPSEIVTDEYGQLMFYQKTKSGEFFVFETWGREPDWRIFRLFDGQTREYNVAKGWEMEVIVSFDISADAMYLYRHNDDTGDYTVSVVDINSGAQTDYVFPLAEHGLKVNNLVNSTVAFDRQNKFLVFLYYDEYTECYLGSYSFERRAFKSVLIEKRVTDVLLYGDRYLVVNADYYTVPFMLYDKDLNLLEEKKITPPREGKVGPVYNPRISAYIADGVLYGCASGEDGTVVYAADVETGKLLTLYQTITPKDMRLGAFEIYDTDGCQPFMN